MARVDHWQMSTDTARRLNLAAQGFAIPVPKGPVNSRHLQRIMARLKVIQLDSVPVIIRTQYLPFHSRLGPYNAELFDDVAYSSGRWFEAWAHEASLLPVESEPLFRWLKERSRRGQTWKNLARLAADKPLFVEAVLAEVTERGEAKSSELSTVKRQPTKPAGDAAPSDGWWNRSDTNNALDWLFRIGELGVRRVGNFQKVFCPLNQVVPSDVLAQPTPEESDAQRELALQAVRSLGVGTAGDVADYFRLPIVDIRARLAELVEAGSIVTADVEGWKKPAFADPEARVPRRIEASAVLSPFDPVVWHRERTRRLFGFDYKLEIYTPKHKRRWGYYVLPVLVDGRLVARIDAKTYRSERRLAVQAAYCEQDCGDVVGAVAAAVIDLAELVGADDIVVEQRGDLSQPLRASLKAATL